MKKLFNKFNVLCLAVILLGFGGIMQTINNYNNRVQIDELNAKIVLLSEISESALTFDEEVARIIEEQADINEMLILLLQNK